MGHDREHHEGCAAEGYGGKFEVHRTDGSGQPGGRHHGCRYLVLDLDHDPSARHVARLYAEDIEATRGVFAHDLLNLLATLGAVPHSEAKPQPVPSQQYTDASGYAEYLLP